MALLWPRGLHAGVGGGGESVVEASGTTLGKCFQTNLTFQVREVEPRNTVTCPGSQAIFMLQLCYFYQSVEKKNEPGDQGGGWVRFLGGD